MACAGRQGLSLVLFKKAFLANTHAPLLPPLETGFVVSILSITLFPHDHLSFLTFTLTIRQKKNCLLLPLDSCPSDAVKFGVTFELSQLLQTPRAVASVYAFGRPEYVRLQATVMTMCALQGSFLDNVAAPTAETFLSH